jgi:hypothetical protein
MKLRKTSFLSLSLSQVYQSDGKSKKGVRGARGGRPKKKRKKKIKGEKKSIHPPAIRFVWHNSNEILFIP